MDGTDYESSISSCDEEDERLRPLPVLVPRASRPVVDVGTRSNTVVSNSRLYSNVASNTFNGTTTSSASSNQHIATKATTEKKAKINSTSVNNFHSAQNVSAVDIDPAVIMYSEPVIMYSEPFKKDASCQTVVTGDILSLNFYQGDGCMMDRELTSLEDIISLIMGLEKFRLCT